MANPTEPRGLQFVSLVLGSKRVMGEAQHLGAILYLLSVPMVTLPFTTGVDLGDIIRFASVFIPRLMTRRDISKVLALVAFGVSPWYGDQKLLPPEKHKNPVLLLSSHLVVYGVFCCLPRAKYIVFLVFFVRIVSLKTERKVGPKKRFFP
jgi:hypothetical protein